MTNRTTPRFYCYIVVLILTPVLTSAQTKDARNPIIIDSKNIRLKEIGPLPKVIKEASGLEMTNGNHLWTHNDGGVPVLYCLDTTGHLIKTLHLNHPNAGWEDLTRDDDGNFYIGAFGNNKNDKKQLKVYKIPDPEGIQTDVYTGESIKYHYKDQKAFPPPNSQKNFDMDAFTNLGDSLYLFTKNKTTPFTGYTKVYALPRQSGEYDIAPVDSIYLGKGPMIEFWVTDADISPDRKTLALLSHDCIWIIKDFKGHKFSSGNIYQVNLNHFSHKAGLCFAANDKVYIVDELELDILGGKLYVLDLKGIIP